MLSDKDVRTCGRCDNADNDDHDDNLVCHTEVAHWLLKADVQTRLEQEDSDLMWATLNYARIVVELVCGNGRDTTAYGGGLSDDNVVQESSCQRGLSVERKGNETDAREKNVTIDLMGRAKSQSYAEVCTSTRCEKGETKYIVGRYNPLLLTKLNG